MITQLNRVCITNTGSHLIESRPCIDCHQSMRLLLIYLFGCPNKMLSRAKKTCEDKSSGRRSAELFQFLSQAARGGSPPYICPLAASCYDQIFVPALPVKIRYLSSVSAHDIFPPSLSVMK